MVLNRVTSEDKTIYTPSPSPAFKVGGFCCFLQVAQYSGRTCLEGMGEGKVYVSPLKLVKHQEGPLGLNVNASISGLKMSNSQIFNPSALRLLCH